MAIQYTPTLGLPYPEVTDAPLIASRDLRALAQKMDSEGAQIRGESTSALTAAQAAEALAAQAVARANAIEEPIHVGPDEPTDGEDLWVDTDADGGEGTQVSAADIIDATPVGRNVLTAPLAVNARNALDIWTGTRALLDQGTDTAERTWDAKELHEYVTDQVAAGGGAASWDDLTGKPETFPPSAHNHDDRYYTEAETDGLIESRSPVGHSHDDRYYRLTDPAVLPDRGSANLTKYPGGIDSITVPGRYSVWSAATANELGLPGSAAGSIAVFTFGNVTEYIYSAHYSSRIRQYGKRNAGSSVGAWTEISVSDESVSALITPGTATHAAIEGMIPDPGQGGTVTKTSAYKPAAGIGSDDTLTAFTQRFLIDIPSPTSRWRIRVYNEYLRYGVYNRPGLTHQGTWVGKPALSAGAPTGAFAGDYNLALGTWTPEGTDSWVSDWIINPDHQLHGTMLVSQAWTAETPMEVQATHGRYWESLTDASLGPQRAATGLVESTRGHLDIVIEYETVTASPVVLWLGDSQSQGAGLGDHRLSHPHQYARRHGVPVISSGYAGSGTANYTLIPSRKYDHLGPVTPDIAVIELGTNDLGSREASAISTDLITIAQGLRTAYPSIRAVHLLTIPPKDYAAGAPAEARRVALNEWIRSHPVGIDAVVDADRVLYDPANPLRLTPEYAQADQLHWTTLGQAAVAAAVPA